MGEWEPLVDPEDIAVGNKLNISSVWGNPSLPSSLITEVTHVDPDGQFYWSVIQPSPTGASCKIGPKEVILNNEGWKVQKAFVTFKYDPTQAGDTEEDI